MNTRLLPVQLREEEIKVKGEELAKATNNHRDLEREKKSSAALYTKQMKESTENLLALAQIVATGTEERHVPVTKEFDPKRNLCKIFRDDTHDLVESRSMTAEEYQQEMFDDDEILLEREG